MKVRTTKHALVVSVPIGRSEHPVVLKGEHTRPREITLANGMRVTY